MPELRNRKKEPLQQQNKISDEKNKNISSTNVGSNKHNIDENEKNYKINFKLILKILIISFGLAIAAVISYFYSKYIKLLHETYLWFSNLQVCCNT